jgi:aryl-alcohol dehydrogenase-like predicted oxidoreductase
MKYRTLGRTDLAVSQIACGTWAFASDAAPFSAQDLARAESLHQKDYAAA